MRKFILILFSLPVIIYSCTSGEAKNTEQKINKEPEKKATSKLVQVEAAQPEFTISLPGELLPYEEVDVYPKVRGFIKKLYADRGTPVKKGQLLAVLEAPEMVDTHASKVASTQTAYQKYHFSKQAFERLKRASQKAGSIAAIELERAYSQVLADSAAYVSLKAETAASKQLNEYLKIRAPFSGIITSRNFSEGALTGESAGEPLFRLAQTNKLRLRVAIPEKEKSALHKDAEASFTVIGIPGEVFTARVSRSGEVVDAKSRSVITEFDVENEDKKLTAGQYAKVELLLKRGAPALWVPKSSVVRSQSGTFVVKSENGKAARVQVIPGISTDSTVEVFGNLTAGDQVLLKGSAEIKEGTAL